MELLQNTKYICLDFERFIFPHKKKTKLFWHCWLFCKRNCNFEYCIRIRCIELYMMTLFENFQKMSQKCEQISYGTFGGIIWGFSACQILRLVVFIIDSSISLIIGRQPGTLDPPNPPNPCVDVGRATPGWLQGQIFIDLSTTQSDIEKSAIF